MLIQQFMRIPEFRDVAPTELRALAARTHVLCLPANRWLLRDGRDIKAYFYLLKGSIETRSPRRKLRASMLGKLDYFYPGCMSARTIKGSQILRIDACQRDFLLQACAGEGGLCATGADPWLESFLSSHMMRQLPGQVWQQLLGAFQLRCYPRGAKILRRGSPGSHCFVIEAGTAVVHEGSDTLCRLGPGDFFGEDALVLGCRRNADVSASQDMRVHAIHSGVFAQVLLESLVQFVAHWSHGVMLILGDPATLSPPGRLAVSLRTIREQAEQLDPEVCHYVSGGSRRERALCAFLLIQRGFRAYPLDDG